MSVSDGGSGTGGSGSSPSVVGCGEEVPPRIVALVPMTENTKLSTTKYRTKVDSQPFVVRALTSPDDSSVWDQLQWTGGKEVADATANFRQVTRTQPADDVRVIVTLGNDDAPHVQLAITATLVRIDHVDGAAYADGAWHAPYDENATVVVVAVTDPDNDAARALVEWDGDGQVIADRPGHYALLRTADASVVASLGPKDEEFSVVIDPILTALTVAQAAKNDNGEWVAPYSPGDSDPVILTASTKPSTSNAHSLIRWQGGEGGGAANTRYVRRRIVGPSKVSASLPTTSAMATVVIVPRLLALHVTNAANAGGTNWTADYSATLTDVVLLTAVTAPDEAEVHQQLVWTHGNPVPGHPEQHTVPRAPLAQTTVTVTLGAESLSAQLTIVPVLVSLGVAHAADLGGGNWSADYSATLADVVRLTAVTAPDTAPAHAQLVWTDGDAVPGHLEQRTVPRAVLKQTAVTVALGAGWRSAQIEIVPVLVSLGVAHATDRGGGNWSADYSATPTDLVELTAVTAPNTAPVHMQLVWTDGDPVPGHDDQHTVTRGTLRRTDVSVRLGAATLTQAIFVRPILAALAVQPPAVVVLAPSYKALTDAADLVAVATTVPDTAEAWAEIVWNAGSAGLSANLRTYGRAAAGMVSITATIDATALTATVDVRTAPVLRLDSMAFVNHRPVALDNGTGYVPSPQWTRTQLARSAVCYTAGVKLNVSLTVAVTTAGSHDLPVLFRGTITVAGTVTTFEQLMTVLTTDASVTVAVEADVALPAGVHHAANAQIAWVVELDGAPAAALATTDFDLYVMLRASTGSVPDFQTLVHVSCAAADAETVDANVFGAIWTAFPPLAMSRASDHADLTYWLPNTSKASSTALLLQAADGSGQCGAWAELLRDMCEVHGIASVRKVHVLAARRWDAWGAAKECKILFDVNPLAPGQRNPHPPGAFYNHFIVHETTSNRYYDPSYGIGPYVGVGDWKAVALTGAQKVPANDETCLLNLSRTLTGPGTVLYFETPVDVTVLDTCTLDYNTGSATAALGAPYPKGADENVILPGGTTIGTNVTAEGVYPVRSGDAYTFPAPLTLTADRIGTVPGGATVSLPGGVNHTVPGNLAVSVSSDLGFPNAFTFACVETSPQLTLPVGTTLQFPTVTFVVAANANVALSNGSTIDGAPITADSIVPLTVGRIVVVISSTIVLGGPVTCALPPGTGVQAPASGPVTVPANTRLRVTSGPMTLGGPLVVTYVDECTNLTVPMNATLNYPATPPFMADYNVILPAGARVSRTTPADGVATVYAGETILAYATTSITLGGDQTGRLPAETRMTVPGGVTATMPATCRYKLGSDLAMPDDTIVFTDCVTALELDRA